VLRNKKDFETELQLSQGLSFKASKIYITGVYTHLVAELYKNTILRGSVKAGVGSLFTVTGRMNCPLALAGRRIS